MFCQAENSGNRKIEKGAKLLKRKKNMGTNEPKLFTKLIHLNNLFCQEIIYLLQYFCVRKLLTESPSLEHLMIPPKYMTTTLAFPENFCISLSADLCSCCYWVNLVLCVLPFKNYLPQILIFPKQINPFSKIFLIFWSFFDLLTFFVCLKIN